MKKLFSILSLCVILGSGKPAVVLDIHSAFAAETLKPAAVEILTPVEMMSCAVVALRLAAASAPSST
jgi:hypothetical protein